MEIEAKYALMDAREAEQILKDSFWKNYLTDQALIEAYEARYLDSAKSDVAALMSSVRLRREGQAALVTIKWPLPDLSVENEAIKIRGEYNLELSSGDFTSWREELLAQESIYSEVPAALLDIIQQEELRARYRATFDRYHNRIRYKSSLFEFSMDQGFLLVDNASERISEMEIELLEGEAQDLLDFCRELENHFKLKALTESKFSRLLSLEKNYLGR